MNTGPTEDEALKEEIDPSHDDHLGNHHHHLGLHTGHHAVHGSWVGHGIWRSRRCIARFRRSIFEVSTCLEGVREMVRNSPIECWGYRRVS